jgi:hypothetical protein
MLQKIKSLQSVHILFLLLLADLFFIMLHVFHKLPPIEHAIPVFEDKVFSISQDRGLAESFGYVQELWILVAFGWLVFQHRKPQYWGWSLLFIYFLLDDMLGFHEWMGDNIGPAMNNILANTRLHGMKMDSLGELAGISVIGLFFFIILFTTFRKSDADTKKNFRIITLLVAALLFFGVFLDFADTFLPPIESLKSIARLVEDGGEMLATSFIAWYAYLLAGLDPAQPAGVPPKL